MQGPQVTSDETQQEPRWHDILQKISTTRQLYVHYLNGHSDSKSSAGNSSVQKLFGYKAKNDRNKLLDSLVSDAIQLITSANIPCAIIRNSTPSYADLGYALSKPSDKDCELRLSFGLQLLLESYATYLCNSIPTQVSHCRLGSLRLARQAIGSLGKIINNETCFPCKCTSTLSYHLHNLAGELTSFAKFKCWNLYFQSPWVAGNHLLEILDLCYYYGGKLLAYRRYVGALVHSYNVLEQLAGLEKIPILEHLCDTYKDIFFPGGRPETNFRSCWTRYVGARLNFKKGHKSRNHRDSWCMAIPTHAARKAAGLGVCNGTKDGRSE
jgi:hypothetical protein